MQEREDIISNWRNNEKKFKFDKNYELIKEIPEIMWSILENVLCAVEKILCFAVWGLDFLNIFNPLVQFVIQSYSFLVNFVWIMCQFI